MKRILVIDDDAIILENISDLLEMEGFEVFRAKDGIEGVELAMAVKPDLIITDIKMPKLDGFGVLKAVSESPKTSNIPVILLSARSDKSQQRFGMELGADDFLAKPFTPEQLFASINARLRKKSIIDTASKEMIKEFSLNIASNIPHELRTPLNGILASSQFLNEYSDTLDKETLNEMHATIHTSAKRLESLIYKYLVFVETELIILSDDKMNFARDYVSLSAGKIITNTIEKVAIKNKREADINLNIVSADLKIYNEHLIALIMELLDNAIKFSKAETKIGIETIIDNGFCVLSISDNGIGMTDEEIQQISVMKQFGRKEIEQQGLGLGLAIVQRMMEIYQGQMYIESKKNAFTKVTVKLPIIRGK